MIHPGDGVPVQAGGYVYVDNWTSHNAWVQIKRSDGTVVAEFAIAPNSKRDFRVPKDSVLVGEKLTTTATAGPHTASSTNPIVAPGVATDESSAERDSLLDRALTTAREIVQSHRPIALA